MAKTQTRKLGKTQSLSVPALKNNFCRRLGETVSAEPVPALRNNFGRRLGETISEEPVPALRNNFIYPPRPK
jgi:hypothetical protein